MATECCAIVIQLDSCNPSVVGRGLDHKITKYTKHQKQHKSRNTLHQKQQKSIYTIPQKKHAQIKVHIIHQKQHKIRNISKATQIKMPRKSGIQCHSLMLIVQLVKFPENVGRLRCMAPRSGFPSTRLCSKVPRSGFLSSVPTSGRQTAGSGLWQAGIAHHSLFVSHAQSDIATCRQPQLPGKTKGPLGLSHRCYCFESPSSCADCRVPKHWNTSCLAE